jgi:hypothetical protein
MLANDANLWKAWRAISPLASRRLPRHCPVPPGARKFDRHNLNGLRYNPEIG